MKAGKLPPQALELEEAVLGALLVESGSSYVQDVLCDLKQDYFYKEQNSIICESILNLINKNDNVDILTVVNELKRMGKLDYVGGAYYVSQLTNRVSSAANIHFHLKIITQMYLKREVIKLSSESITRAYDDTVDLFDIIDEAEKGVNKLTSNIIVDKITSSYELYEESKLRNEKLLNNKETFTGVPTGYIDLDKLTGGWQNSDLIILAARPGMGKTSLALEFLKNPALKGMPTAFFSLEMNKQQCYSRLQSQESGYLLSDILRNGVKNKEDFYNKCKPLAEAPIFIDDTAAITLFELRNKARKLKRDKDIKLLIIDYLQLMTGKGYNKENEVSEISKGLKSLAKELNIPIIALSQLSRAVESRGGGKIPMLSDLRDSGSIEQDADLVSFIYRHEYYGLTEDESGNSTLGKAVIIIAKHRNGSINDVILRFEGHNTSFKDPKKVEETLTSIEPNNEFDSEQKYNDTPF